MNYKTEFELTSTEYKVWLLKQDVKIDSIQLHYQGLVDCFFTTNSDLDIKKCTIIRTTVYKNSSPEKTKFKL